ncbi:MAG: hypothetical protein CME06_15425 [Gemmatimonadetes bacterium]|nr:hypothetical protein [Gemmatimonadota bacterium]
MFEAEGTSIVSDVIMPGLCGPDFVVQAAENGPLPRVLFVSGYTGNTLWSLRAFGDEVDLLQKPFTASALVARVRRTLDRSSLRK